MGALNLRKESTGGFIAGKKERVEGEVEVATKKGKKKGKRERKKRWGRGGRRRFNQSTKT